MSAHEVRLIGRDEVAQGTLAFRFERPAGFGFEPGQAVNLTLLQAPGGDPKRARHAFSIVSAPFEDELTVATRMRDSAYKRSLGALAAGARARIEGPFGQLMRQADYARPAVLIAGGIGITPFVSVLRQAARANWPRPFSLLYASRRPGSAAYLAELERLSRDSAGRFRMLATMTGASGATDDWRGETRRIGPPLMQVAADGFASPVYYIVGPAGLVDGVQSALRADGVMAEDMRSETFYGY